MKNAFAAAAVFCASIPAVSAVESVYPVTTATGQVVQVRESDLKTAYLNTLGQANKQETNEDGSVSILNPRYLVNGENYSVAWVYDGGYDEDDQKAVAGFCLHHGFGNAISWEVSGEKPAKVVFLKADGSISWTHSDNSNSTNVFGLKLIICGK